AFRGLLPHSAHAATAAGFPPGVWGGNIPTYCHDFHRDGGTLPSVAPSRRVDVCIVGGGLAGLTAAYKLRDASILLLEHLDRIGGHAVRDRWNGVWYSGAAAYFVTPEPPLDALYEELKFPLTKIQEPADSAILSYNRILDTFGEGMGRLPYPASVRKDFARAKKDFLEILNGDDCPVMPLADTSDASRKFDDVTFADWMLKEKRYHPAVKAYVDLYCRSAFGAPSSENVSAFAGLNFYVSEFDDRYSFPGGNALAAELLRDAVDKAGANRILSGATVVSVEPKGDRVHVTYVDRSGRPACIEAKAAVMASPKYITRHLVRGLPADQAEAMGELKYGSYVVANVLCKTPIAESSYDTWTDVSPFTDFIVADWVTRGADKKAKTRQQVLTVYYPVSYQHALLLTDDAYDAYRGRVVENMEVLYPGAAAKIEDVRLYRWGHALCHAAPGWYTKRSPIASRAFGRVLFAHSDNQGLPAFEAALVEGMNAAEEARKAIAGA
ncbi:MAG TPA: FAD-dependent oxidoreductase, partial [Thermoanaerobaculia bacterium]